MILWFKSRRSITKAAESVIFATCWSLLIKNSQKQRLQLHEHYLSRPIRKRTRCKGFKWWTVWSAQMKWLRNWLNGEYFSNSNKCLMLKSQRFLNLWSHPICIFRLSSLTSLLFLNLWIKFKNLLQVFHMKLQWKTHMGWISFEFIISLRSKSQMSRICLSLVR